MTTKYFYIHGLNSSKNGKKFLELKKQYPNIDCLEWTTTDDITKKLSFWKNLIKLNNEQFDNVCIIASSTGCNFAIQLTNMIKEFYIHLVLINPLLNVHYINDIEIMPENIKQYLIEVYDLKATMIMIGLKDDVINNNKFLNNYSSIKNNNQILIDKNGTHKFENLCEYYSDIDLFINRLYI